MSERKWTQKGNFYFSDDGPIVSRGGPVLWYGITEDPDGDDGQIIAVGRTPELTMAAVDRHVPHAEPATPEPSADAAVQLEGEAGGNDGPDDGPENYPGRNA